MRFIETPVFTSEIQRHLSDDAYQELQVALLLRPDWGAVIPGSGGLRKIRWSVVGRGKRGGLRVIYYWARAQNVVFLLDVYKKSERADLTPRQLRILARRVTEEFR